MCSAAWADDFVILLEIDNNHDLKIYLCPSLGVANSLVGTQHNSFPLLLFNKFEIINWIIMMIKTLNEIKRDIALITLNIQDLDSFSKQSAICYIKESIDLLLIEGSQDKKMKLDDLLYRNKPQKGMAPLLPSKCFFLELPIELSIKIYLQPY